MIRETLVESVTIPSRHPPQVWVDALKNSGVTTLGKLSYAVSLPGTPPSADDMDSFTATLRPGAPITLGDSSAMKQLIFESQTMTVAELRSAMQSTDEVHRKLPASERSMRIEAQKQKVVGLPLEGPLAVAHSVHDKLATMRENDELKYLPPSTVPCSSSKTYMDIIGFTLPQLSKGSNNHVLGLRIVVL